MLPLTRASWEELSHLCHGRETTPRLRHLPTCISAVQAISGAAAWLLEHLYNPDATVGACVTWVSLRRAGVGPALDDEAINWGDLHASVDADEAGWRVTLEEAEEGWCPALCAYVQTWLESWGWKPVVVVTQW